MDHFAILTDSSADLPAWLVRQMDIQVIPLSITMEGKTFRNYPDNRELDPHTFYELLRKGKTATTSAVNMAQYVEAMEPILQQERDILVLAFSSGLSATYNSGVIAAQELSLKYPGRRICVVDTLCASLGQGLLVWLAARERERGRTLEEVRLWVEEHKLSIAHQVTVNDLLTLKRGGRIDTATAVVGTMLAIKPMIHLDEEGRLVNIAKCRGRAASLKALVDTMERTAIDPQEQTIFISHGDCPEDAKAVEDMIRERFAVKDVIIGYVGPVIGAHTGPGVVALFYRAKER